MKTLGGLFLSALITFTTFATYSDRVRGQSLPDRDPSNSIDLQRLTCRELLKSEADNRSDLIIFMHGYMSGKKSDLRINVPALADVTDRVIDNCIDNPDTQLLRVFERYR